jgi:hypothetical protein
MKKKKVQQELVMGCGGSQAESPPQPSAPSPVKPAPLALDRPEGIAHDVLTDRLNRCRQGLAVDVDGGRGASLSRHCSSRTPDLGVFYDFCLSIRGVHRFFLRGHDADSVRPRYLPHCHGSQRASSGRPRRRHQSHNHRVYCAPPQAFCCSPSVLGAVPPR